MTASYIGRWAAILTSFTSAQIIACPGTRQQHHILQHSTSCVFPEQLKNFTVFHWPHSVPPHSNDATGVSIALRQDFASKKSVQVFSPPKELQGRAGAVLAHSKRDTTAVICLYLSAIENREEDNNRKDSSLDSIGLRYCFESHTYLEMVVQESEARCKRAGRRDD